MQSRPAVTVEQKTFKAGQKLCSLNSAGLVWLQRCKRSTDGGATWRLAAGTAVRGSCFPHRIPAARGSGKEALYIPREKHQCCPTRVSLYLSRPSAVERSQNKSAEISFYGGVGTERSAGPALSQKLFSFGAGEDEQTGTGDDIKREKSISG